MRMIDSKNNHNKNEHSSVIIIHPCIAFFSDNFGNFFFINVVDIIELLANRKESIVDIIIANTAVINTHFTHIGKTLSANVRYACSGFPSGKAAREYSPVIRVSISNINQNNKDQNIPFFAIVPVLAV